MAPKVAKDGIPKPVADLKAALGETVTADAMGGADMHVMRNKAFSAMRTHLATYNTDKLEEFKNLESDILRRQWLAEYTPGPGAPDPGPGPRALVAGGKFCLKKVKKKNTARSLKLLQTFGWVAGRVGEWAGGWIGA